MKNRTTYLSVFDPHPHLPHLAPFYVSPDFDVFPISIFPKREALSDRTRRRIRSNDRARSVSEGVGVYPQSESEKEWDP